MSEKMIAWLRGQRPSLPADATVRRIYPGRHQRAAGSWSWFVYTDEGLLNIGGYARLCDLLRCPNLKLVKDSSPLSSCYVELALQPGHKTRSYEICNNRSNDVLGYIKWHAPWRCYCLFPWPGTVWSMGCLRDVLDFMDLKFGSQGV